MTGPVCQIDSWPLSPKGPAMVRPLVCNWFGSNSPALLINTRRCAGSNRRELLPDPGVGFTVGALALPECRWVSMALLAPSTRLQSGGNCADGPLAISCRSCNLYWVGWVGQGCNKRILHWNWRGLSHFEHR